MELKVKASKNYSVIIKKDLSGLKNYLSLITGDKVAVIKDSNVNKYYKNTIESLINKQTFSYVFEAGEQSKNAENYLKILNFLAENGFKRNDTVIAFGGGVTGDLAGFASATYMRGINLIQIPTSLLAMVDSSVGGKTAIDLPQGKNLVGAFYQPSLVYISLEFLKTLPKREILSGLGEITKYAFIGGITTKELKNGITAKLIYKCVKIKRDIVQKDEKENNIRKYLNLGHTVGHAIESLSNYELSHGESVLKGLKYTIDISKKLGVLSSENTKKCYEILNAVNYDYSCPYKASELIKYVKTDKKGRGDNVDFVLINNSLTPEIKTLKIEELENLL